MRKKFSRIALLIICCCIAFIILLSDPTLAVTGGKTGVKIMEKEAVGQYLADGNGVTLYRFTKDEKNISHCIEGCAANWPPFHADLSGVGDGLEAADFGVITRTDNRQQTTYKDMPLYYFINDKYPGDTFGDGIGDAWLLITP